MSLFSKKYVFETRYTRNKRLLRNLFALFSFFLISILLICVYIPIHATNKKEQARQMFFEKAPDVIAVYTGDSGRIAYALSMADKYPSAKIFISGVYAKNNLKILLENQGKNISVDDYLEQESHHIELDYLARNTVENGISTLNYLNRSQGTKNILIISSDYHILRINLILHTLIENNEEYHFYFDSISSDYSKWTNLKKLFKEVYKLLKTSTFLVFWEKSSDH